MKYLLGFFLLVGVLNCNHLPTSQQNIVGVGFVIYMIWILSGGDSKKTPPEKKKRKYFYEDDDD